MSFWVWVFFLTFDPVWEISLKRISCNWPLLEATVRCKGAKQSVIHLVHATRLRIIILWYFKSVLVCEQKAERDHRWRCFSVQYVPVQNIENSCRWKKQKVKTQKPKVCVTRDWFSLPSFPQEQTHILWKQLRSMMSYSANKVYLCIYFCLSALALGMKSDSPALTLSRRHYFLIHSSM